MNVNKLFLALKRWMLILAMVSGASIYLIYHSIPSLHPAGPFLLGFCKKIQPCLLFTMLFLCFCRIEPRQMKLRGWQGILLLIQGGSFALLSALTALCSHSSGAFADFVNSNRLIVEAAMLCLICPTATACAVVTHKLGGDMTGVLTYTVLVNLLVAVLVPGFVPLLYPDADVTFLSAFWKILGKVFPLLIMPCVCAWAVRFLLPSLHRKLLNYTQLSFYIWAICLTLAILMSTRAIVLSGDGAGVLVPIALTSLLCCAFQFWAGKKTGSRYGDSITAGQSLGQKNTVFVIWLAYTFFNPVLSVTGGFYSIWHNLFNTWQLNRNGASL